MRNCVQQSQTLILEELCPTVDNDGLIDLCVVVEARSQAGQGFQVTVDNDGLIDLCVVVEVRLGKGFRNGD